MGNTMSLSTEDMARLMKARWTGIKQSNGYAFANKAQEDACMTLFALGYHSAWRDMHDLSSGMVAIDELLGEQE